MKRFRTTRTKLLICVALLVSIACLLNKTRNASVVSDALIDELVSVTRPMPGTILIFSDVDQEKIPAKTRAKVEALGSKAIPIFLEMAGTRNSPVKAGINSWFNIHSKVLFRFRGQFENQSAAEVGFAIIGANAHEAIPALVKLTSSQDARVRATALKCLEQVIGPEHRGSGDHYDILSSAANRGSKDLDSEVQDAAVMIQIRLTVID